MSDLTENPKEFGKLKMEHLFAEKNVVLSFDRKSGKTLKIREIENDNFYFTEKKIYFFFTFSLTM